MLHVDSALLHAMLHVDSALLRVMLHVDSALLHLSNTMLHVESTMLHTIVHHSTHIYVPGSGQQTIFNWHCHEAFLSVCTLKALSSSLLLLALTCSTSVVTPI